MKSKSHIYMANLLRDYIINRHGRVYVYKDYYTIPDDFLTALIRHPEEFRAGAVGPDFFPDMFFGQTQMHPKNSGVWIKRMQTVLSRYQKSSPEYYPALAFYLGFLTHYATDMFGHEDVNYYAGGFFPSISDLLIKLIKIGEAKEGKEDLSIIIRHMMVETYMDDKVPKNEPLDIEVPLDFVKKCFGTLEAYSFMVDNGCADTSSLTSFNVLPQLIKNYYKACYKSNTIRGIEKREEYINSWLEIWSRFAKIDVKYGLGEAYESTKESLVNLMVNYALSFADMEGAGDAVKTVMNIFGLATQAVADVLTLGLDRLFSKVSDKIGELIKERILGSILSGIVLSLGGKKSDIKSVKAEKEYIESLFKDPKLILNGEEFCLAHNEKAKEFFEKNKKFKEWAVDHGKNRPRKIEFTDYLDYKWGNYGKERDIDKQDYLQFKRCLRMGLLCMIGSNNLNKMFTKHTKELHYTFSGLDYKLGTYSIQVTISTKSNATADTEDDVYLEIDDGTNDSYRFFLDHGGIDDFEEDRIYTYNIYLPEFVPYAKIKGMRVVKFGNDDLDVKTAYVSDRATGRLIARSGSFSLTDHIKYKELTICAKLQEKDKTNFEHVAGIYMLYFGQDNTKNKELTLTLSTKSGYENSWTYDFCRIYGGSGIRFFPLFARCDDIKKIEYKLDSRRTLSCVYLFEGTSFRCIGYDKELKKDDKSHEITFEKYNFFEPGYIWKTSDLVVIAKTSDNLCAGTDDDVTLWINFYNRKPISIDLDKDGNDLEAGSVGSYFKKFNSEIDVRDIKSFKLIKSGKKDDDWAIDFIALLDCRYRVPIFVEKFAGPTVLEGKSEIEINDGFWKQTQKDRYYN